MMRRKHRLAQWSFLASVSGAVALVSCSEPASKGDGGAGGDAAAGADTGGSDAGGSGDGGS